MLTVIRQPNNKIYTDGKNPPCIQCSVTECGRPGLFPQEWDAICESSRKCELMRGVNWITIDTGGNYTWGCVGPQTHNRRRRRSIHATGLAQYLALSSAITSYVKLRSWQKITLNMMARQTDRGVLFIVDPTGNSGETWFAKFIRANYDALYSTTTRMGDVMRMHTDEQIVVFDLSRRAARRINYATLISLKEGMGTSTKWECRVRIFLPVTVVVFMHRKQNMRALSEDRYNLHYLT